MDPRDNMIFGGLQKQSLIDFPEKVSCVLFTSGCNFTCPYCHNPDLVRGQINAPHVIAEKRLYDFLEKRRGFLEGVVISGGEPTLHPELPGICENIKKMGYPIKLDSNGSRPQVLAQLIHKGYVDYIAMDLKTDPSAYPREISPHDNTASILASIDLIMSAGIPYEFRTTCVKPFVDKIIIEKISQAIEGARCYALQPFKDENILSPEYFQNGPQPYSSSDLLTFQAIAAPWVETCFIR
jgi:pyruvate formate lyase activating enzyme